MLAAKSRVAVENVLHSAEAAAGGAGGDNLPSY